MRGETWGGGEMSKRLLLHGRRHWSAARRVFKLLLLLLNPLQGSQLVGRLRHKLLHLSLQQQCSALACSWSWVQNTHIFLFFCYCYLILCFYLGGRGTLPEPAVLAALPAVAAGGASASSQPLRLYSAEAREA